MSLDDFYKMLKEINEKGMSYCILCGHISENVIEARKHDLAEHYEYVLNQCYGDKQLLMEWASSDQVNLGKQSVTSSTQRGNQDG